jgi:undecaprenyl diphosphate synthase
MSEEKLKHLGIIMDGNRRWAVENGLPKMEGHRRGYENMKAIGDACLKRGLSSLTVFAFSTENWNRSEKEVGYLMALLEDALSKEIDFFIDRKIRMRILGRRDRLSARILKLIDEAEEKTKDFDAMTFGICLNYGGRPELVDVVKKIVESGVPAEEIDEAVIAKNLYWPDMPEPDMIIRTSGEQRLSGFLVWECAYSELYFTETYWPAFDEKELDKALEEFANRQRRFGK